VGKNHSPSQTTFKSESEKFLWKNAIKKVRKVDDGKCFSKNKKLNK